VKDGVDCRVRGLTCGSGWFDVEAGTSTVKSRDAGFGRRCVLEHQAGILRGTLRSGSLPEW
jgi:hypothetical protein